MYILVAQEDIGRYEEDEEEMSLSEEAHMAARKVLTN